jgi:hypothetical protein
MEIFTVESLGHCEGSLTAEVDLGWLVFEGFFWRRNGFFGVTVSTASSIFNHTSPSNNPLAVIPSTVRSDLDFFSRVLPVARRSNAT